jgi:MarC family membrane protein
MADFTAYLKIFVVVYVLVNPLEGIPLFLAHTASTARSLRQAVARTASVSVTLILLGALVIGQGLLEFLSISIGDFTIAGGIIIFLIALRMILEPARKSGAVPINPEELHTFGIVPLAIPLLAGPGAISSVIVYATKGPTGQGCSWEDYVLLATIIVVVGAATWLALHAADPLRRLLGETGVEASTRISGILVAAIAIGMLHEGLVLTFPSLRHI